jgi:hypothetical protein
VTLGTVVKMANLEPLLVERIENGATSRKPAVAEFCRLVLARLGPRRARSGRFRRVPADAPEDAVAEALAGFIAAIEDEGQPDDIPGFVHNVVATMAAFRGSAAVLGRCAACLEAIVPFYPDVPGDVTFECLSVCFAILSGETFLSGDDAFGAVESLQKLVAVWSGTVGRDRMLAAMAPLVANANGVRLDAVVAALGECMRAGEDADEEALAALAESFAAFHPEIELPEFLAPVEDRTDVIDDYEEAFRRLADPEAVFDEVARLVESHADGDFVQFPASLDRILQASWTAIMGKRPVRGDEATWQKTKRIEKQMTKMTETAYCASRFGPRALSRVLRERTM